MYDKLNFLFYILLPISWSNYSCMQDAVYYSEGYTFQQERLQRLKKEIREGYYAAGRL